MTERIVGVGVDLLEIERIGDLISRYGMAFLQKALTPTELAGLGGLASQPTYTARLIAAKEAVMKALGRGLRRATSWRQIEVRDASPGHCSVRLLSPAHENLRIHVAISRHGDVVLAMATITELEGSA